MRTNLIDFDYNLLNYWLAQRFELGIKKIPSINEYKFFLTITLPKIKKLKPIEKMTPNEIILEAKDNSKELKRIRKSITLIIKELKKRGVSNSKLLKLVKLFKIKKESSV